MLKPKKSRLRLLAAAIGLLTAAAAIVPLSTDVKVQNWRVWDHFRSREPLDRIVLVSTHLRNDHSGLYTSEIRNALQRRGWLYRSIDRLFPEDAVVVPSEQLRRRVIQQAQRVLEVHGGDILIYGEAGVRDTARVVIYVGPCCKMPLDLDFSSSNWSKGFVAAIEALAFQSASSPLWDYESWPIDESPESVFGITESKLDQLSEIAGDEDLRYWARESSSYARMLRALNEQDDSAMREMRLELEGNDEARRDRVRTNTRIADLYMLEGLIGDDPFLIEQGLRVAVELPTGFLAEEMENDDAVVQPLSRADGIDFQRMVNLVIACGDHTLMDRLMELIANHHGCDPLAFDCQADMEYMLLAMDIHVSSRNRGELEQGINYMTNYLRFRGIEHDWRDPFVQGIRLGRRKLAEDKVKPPDMEGGATYCSTLRKWMTTKGWQALGEEAVSRTAEP